MSLNSRCFSERVGMARMAPGARSSERVGMARMAPGARSRLIVIPIHFVILDVGMVYEQYSLNQWVTCEHVTAMVSEINGLWKQAGIGFKPVGCTVVRRFNRAQAEAIGVIEKSDRAVEEEDPFMDEIRRDAYKEVTEGLGVAVPNAFNVYILPFTGSTRQGNALGGYPSSTSLIVASWTNKPQGGKPRRTLMDDPTQSYGTLPRTVAHEIGHLLDLSHPRTKYERSIERRLLMSGGSGRELTPEQIQLSYEVARKVDVRFKRKSG